MGGRVEVIVGACDRCGKKDLTGREGEADELLELELELSDEKRRSRIAGRACTGTVAA